MELESVLMKYFFIEWSITLIDVLTQNIVHGKSFERDMREISIARDASKIFVIFIEKTKSRTTFKIRQKTTNNMIDNLYKTDFR